MTGEGAETVGVECPEEGAHNSEGMRAWERMDDKGQLHTG